jgi:branched-chain amino acid transport system ATP-binding protein
VSFVLEASGLTRKFGGVQALADVGFTVDEGEIRAVIGPNGAGKTTLLDVITGFTPPESGSVKLRGEEILGQPPHRLASRGLMRTFQGTRLIPGLTVRENVMLGAHHLTRARFVANGLWLPLARREERALRQRADRVLSFLQIDRLAERDARSLPAGIQRLVEVGRALAAGPTLLLLDEPGAGLVESEIQALAEVLRAVQASGATVLLIEHNVNMVMSVSDRVLVLNAGMVIADDVPSAVQRDPAVLSAYLGGATP